MAVRDDTARARLPVSADDTPHDPPDADPRATCPMAHALRLSTLDDVALALYALGRVRDDVERSRTEPVRPPPTEPVMPLLSPFQQDGLCVAIQCLEQYALWLSEARVVNV